VDQCASSDEISPQHGVRYYPSPLRRSLLGERPAQYTFHRSLRVLFSWVVMRNDDNLLLKRRPLIMRFRQSSLRFLKLLLVAPNHGSAKLLPCANDCPLATVASCSAALH
jgi:hypothetical protein